MSNAAPHETTPLLVSLATDRTGEDSLPGQYNSKRCVWTIESGNGEEPIILTARESAELVTKTKVKQEQDDPGAMAFLDSTTKTMAQLERDDTALLSLLELSTKTEARPERDD